MRVITGSARGRRLKEPNGMEIRPTTDMVKEAVFSAIQFDIEGRRVLDLFAGTGQMGIEALSRGAAHCTFVDVSKQAISLVKENLAHCQLEERAQVVQGDYLAYLSRSQDTYDLVFLDPPYDSEIIKKALQTITRIDKISEHGIIVCENTSGYSWPEVPQPYELKKEYRYGKVSVAVYRRRPDNGQ